VVSVIWGCYTFIETKKGGANMTRKQKEINKKIRAIDRLAGMFKVNGANRKAKVRNFRFVLKSY